jgi:hypothetical protein
MRSLKAYKTVNKHSMLVGRWYNLKTEISDGDWIFKYGGIQEMVILHKGTCYFKRIDGLIKVFREDEWVSRGLCDISGVISIKRISKYDIDFYLTNLE